MNGFLVDARDVLALFLIPIGTGIPAGVALARARGLYWPQTMALYLVSDVLLALAFEPVLVLVGRAVRSSVRLSRFAEAYRLQMHRVIAGYGTSVGWFKLVMISFGIDPMTGRAVAMASGYGFVGGWIVAIAGDMIFFTVLMVSTLCLNDLLGDGTWATILVMTAMFGIPALYRRWRSGSWAFTGVESKP